VLVKSKHDVMITVLFIGQVDIQPMSTHPCECFDLMWRLVDLTHALDDSSIKV